MADDLNFSNEPKGLGPKEPKKRVGKAPVVGPPPIEAPAVAKPPSPQASVSDSATPPPAGADVPAPPVPAKVDENFLEWWFRHLPIFIAIPGLPIAAVIYGVRALAKPGGRSRSTMAGAIASLVLGGLAVLGFAGFVGYQVLRPDQSRSADKLAVGDCVTNESLASEDITEVSSVRVIDCARPHYGEVYYAGTLSPSNLFPGDTRVAELVDADCLAQSDRVLALDDDPDLWIYWLAPTRDAWNVGDRGFVCMLVTDGDATIIGSRLAP